MSSPLDGVLDADRVVIRLPASDRFDVIRLLVAHLAEAEGLSTDVAAAASAAVAAREEELATGLEAGLAVPHGFCAAIDAPLAILATLATPIDFDAMDGETSWCVLLLVEPDTPEGRRRHLDFLGAVAEKWSQTHVRQVVMDANAPAAVLGAFGIAE